MKTITIFAVVLFATSFAVAQDLRVNEVPTAVQNAFSSENSNVTGVEWEKEMDNYKVEFYVKGQEHEIWYSPQGKVLKKEQELMASDLPAAVASAISSKYSGYRVDDVEMNWMAGNTTYEVELEKGREELKVVFDANGKVVSERRD